LAIGLVLIGHWAGFVTQTWQPCPRASISSLAVSSLSERLLNNERIANAENMKKVFTAEQISSWFTSGVTFAKLKLTEEAAEGRFDEEASTKEPRR